MRNTKDIKPFYKYNIADNQTSIDENLFRPYDKDKFVDLINSTLSKDNLNFPILTNNNNVILKFRLTNDNKHVRGVKTGGQLLRVKKLYTSFTNHIDSYKIYKHINKDLYIIDDFNIPSSINIYIEIFPDRFEKTFIHEDGKIISSMFSLNNDINPTQGCVY